MVDVCARPIALQFTPFFVNRSRRHLAKYRQTSAGCMLLPRGALHAIAILFVRLSVRSLHSCTESKWLNTSLDFLRVPAEYHLVFSH